MVSEIQVEGIEETCRMLDEVSSIVATRAYVNGLDAAGEVIEAELWPRVPVDLKAAMNAAHGGKSSSWNSSGESNPGEGGKGPLVSRLISRIEVDPHGRGGVLDVGFGPLGHIALWVEYGHRMITHRPNQRQVGDVPAHPFMRPAFDASAERATDAFIEGVKKTLKGTPGYTEAA